MGRKLVAILAAVLIVLAGAAWWIYSGGNSAWKQSEMHAGAKVLPNLVVSNVAGVHLNGGKEQVTLERKGEMWTVRERGGYPADLQKVAPLLVKLADLKVVQTEEITASLQPRLQLAAPGSDGGGTALDLTDAAGKPLGSITVGKTIDKDSEIPGATKKVPNGRYLLRKDAPTIAIAINDPLNEIDLNPRSWLDKTFAKPERVKTLTLTSGGKPKWSLVRNEEASIAWTLKDAAKGEDLNTATANDTAGALAGVTMVDVVSDPKPDVTGLADGDVLTAETFDGLTYTYTVGKKEGENRYISFAVAGKAERPRERTPGKDEKAEDKTKADKTFKDELAAFDARMEREQAMDKKVFLVADASLQAALKERAALMKSKETAAAPSVPGLDKYEKKAPEKKAPAKK